MHSNERTTKAKLIPIAAILAIAVCAFAVMIPAEEADAEPTGVDSVDDFGAAGSYVLASDINGTLTVPAGEVSIDLAGHKISNNGADNHTIIVPSGAILTIYDSSSGRTGVVDNTVNAKAALFVENGAIVILNGGTFERSLEAGTYTPYTGGGNSYYTIVNMGSLTINDGVSVINDGGFSSNIRNLGTGADNKAIITINGGNITGGVNSLKNDEFGYATINGGVFTNTSQATVLNWSTTEFNGGTFVCDYECIVNGTWHPNGIDTVAAEVGTLTINGGSFTPGTGYETVVMYHNTEYVEYVTLGEISVSDDVSGISISIPEGFSFDGKVSFGNNSIEFEGITAGEDVTISRGSVVITGSMSAEAVEARINAAGGDVVLRDLTITSGNLGFSGDMTLDGTVSVASGASVSIPSGSNMNVIGRLVISSGASLVNDGTLINRGVVDNSGSIGGTGILDNSNGLVQGTGDLDNIVFQPDWSDDDGYPIIAPEQPESDDDSEIAVIIAAAAAAAVLMCVFVLMGRGKI